MFKKHSLLKWLLLCCSFCLFIFCFVFSDQIQRGTTSPSSPATVAVGDQVTFTGAWSHPAGQQPAVNPGDPPPPVPGWTYSWAINGTAQTDTDDTLDHSFDTAGDYTVQVTIDYDANDGGAAEHRDTFIWNVKVVKVELAQAEFDLLRGQTFSLDLTIEPDDFVPTMDIGEYDEFKLSITFDSQLKRFDFTNLIEDSTPVAWVDDVVVDVSSSLPNITLGPVKLKLKKEFQKLWDNIKGNGITLVNSQANIAGDLAKSLVEAELSALNDEDPEAPLYLTQSEISASGTFFKNAINTLIVSAAENFIGDVASGNVPNNIIPESTTFTWNCSTTFTLGGGTISVPGGVSYSQWFRSIVTEGFDANLFNFEGTSAGLQFNGTGPTVTGRWQFSGNGGVSFAKGGGEIGYSFSLFLDLWF